MTATAHAQSKYMTAPQLRLVGTRAATDEALASPSLILDPWAGIGEEIAALGKRTEELLAEELTPPTRTAMEWVAPLLAALRRQNVNAPFRTIPSGEGGIVFEWIDAVRREIIRTIEISADGSIELTDFVDNRFQDRRRIN